MCRYTYIIYTYVYMCILYMYIWTFEKHRKDEFDKIHELNSDDDKANWVHMQIYIYDIHIRKICIYNIHICDDVHIQHTYIYICVYYICVSAHMSLTRSTNSKVTMTKPIGYIFRYSYLIYTCVRYACIIYKYV